MFKICTVVAALTLLLTTPAASGSQSSDAALVAAVKKALSDQDDLRRLTVSVSGNAVTLTGRLPSLWHKQEAIKRVEKVEGVATVAANVELPRLQNDTNLALNIGRALDSYPYYTLFDYVDAVIRQGSVTLTGSVNPQTRDKVREIGEEITRVRGVQDIRNQIVELPASQADDNIRAELYNRLLDNEHLDELTARRIPPFRIVVNNGAVTLFGFVRTELESRELERVARFTNGVLRVQNNVRTTVKSER